MEPPETAQHVQGHRRQRHQPILVALGIADMHPRPRGVDVTDLQAQPLAQAQAKTVGGEEEHPIAQHPRGREHPLGLSNGHDIGQTLRLGRLNQVHVRPGLLQHMGVKELQAIQIEPDRAPGMRLQQIGEIRHQLLLGEVRDFMLEEGPDAPNRPGIGLDGLRL